MARRDVLNFICIVEGRHDFLDLCITCHYKMKPASNGVDARVEVSGLADNPPGSFATLTFPRQKPRV